MATEVAQGKNVADAAKAHGVQHLVWSTLPDVTKISGGKLVHVYHFDGKAAVDDYIRALGVPMTSLVVSFYLENIAAIMRPVGAN